MAKEEDDRVDSNELEFEDQQVAVVFDPLADADVDGYVQETETDPADRRAAKRRRKSSRQRPATPPRPGRPGSFVPLFGGAEADACVRRREALFAAGWARVDGWIQSILRDANAATLDQLAAFVATAPPTASPDRVPAALVMTGPNLAAQDLLFAQLADALPGRVRGRARFVALRAADATNLKAALRKIIGDATGRAADEDNKDEDDGGDEDGRVDADARGAEVTGKERGRGRDEGRGRGVRGRKYLPYDLAALDAHVRAHRIDHVVVAFADSDGVDGGLLSDLLDLLAAWAARIPFALLFGVATSPQLLQARLRKATLRRLHGIQFDVVQAAAVLDRIFRRAVASPDAPLALGPSLLRSLLDRQRDQVVGVHAFVRSLKYLYMCHFYANPLSIFLSHHDDDHDDDAVLDLVQPEHIEALRSLAPFRARVEAAVAAGHPAEARALLEDDDVILDDVRAATGRRGTWALGLVRSLAVLAEVRGPHFHFTDAYLLALADGLDATTDSAIVTDPVRRMSSANVLALIDRVATRVAGGDPSLGLTGWADQPAGATLVAALVRVRADVELLHQRALDTARPVHSCYTHAGGTMRATVVAQRVQLSRDAADLTTDDQAFSRAVDTLAAVLAAAVATACPGPPTALLLHPAWLYDAPAPHRHVFVPRPRRVFERALCRPNVYLGPAPLARAPSPPVSLLYRLFVETGCLINVADLWTAFRGQVRAADDRTALVLFYRALAELRGLGFVKPTGRKTDHIARVKWL